MSESENIAAAPHAPGNHTMDAEDRLRPEFVDKVLDAVEAGDDETARKLVEPLHPADIADLIELAQRDEREGLVKALAGIVDAEVLAEMNDWVREGLLDEMEPQQVADIAGQLETDDAVALIEDLDADEQQAVLQRMDPDDRAAVEEALSYPEESAGRLMQRDICAVPEHWNVGQVIDYLRSTADLPDDFWEVFVVNPAHHPVGTCMLSTILRTPRSTPVSEIMLRDQTLIPVDMDQEDVALRFQKYALVSAAVVDGEGRLVGMITVDDVVHIIQEEAGEDVLLLAGVGDEGDINEPVRLTVRRRLFWLVINLGTAIVAASVVSLFQGEIGKYAVLAVLMPIVAGMGGNAGTQTLAVAVRALATNQLDQIQHAQGVRPRAEDRACQRAFARPADRHRRYTDLPQPIARRSDGRGDGHHQSGGRSRRDSGPGHARPLPRRPGRILGRVRHHDHRRDRFLQLPRAGRAGRARPLGRLADSQARR